MKYRLADGRVVRTYNSDVIEWVPERRDRLSFRFANVVGLGLAAVAASAFIVGYWLGQGWRQAAGAAIVTAVMLPALFWVGSGIGGRALRDEDEREEERKTFIVLIPWAIIAVLATAWVASENPRLF